MKKLKLQVRVSIDGYIAGPNGEMDWMTWAPSESTLAHVMELTGTIDTILLGRKLATGFIPYWEEAAGKPEDPSHAFARIMAATPKVVFTTTLSSSPWTNATLATGELKAEVDKLKQGPGKDLIVYGGGGLVSALIKEDLIDEYHLFVNPAALGRGMPIFEQLAGPRQFTLVRSYSSESGIVAAVYQPKK